MHLESKIVYQKSIEEYISRYLYGRKWNLRKTKESNAYKQSRLLLWLVGSIWNVFLVNKFVVLISYNEHQITNQTTTIVSDDRFI